jgi:predicted outer membrane repeat protein
MRASFPLVLQRNPETKEEEQVSTKTRRSWRVPSDGARFGALVLAGGWLAMLDAPCASAALYTVTNTNDSGAGSLRTAIQQANANAGTDTIQMLSGAAGTIALASALPTLTDSVTIVGRGEALSAIQAPSQGRILTAGSHNGGDTFVLQGLTLTGADYAGDGGALSLSAGNTLTIYDCTFSSNSATGNGGAIRADAALTLWDATFNDNEAGNIGGAIYSSAGALEIHTSSFTGNRAPANRGGAIISSDTTTIADSSFSGNTANTGGAIFFSAASLAVERTTFEDNDASYGGALSLRCFDTTPCGSVDIEDSTFSLNDAEDATLGKGGGIYSIHIGLLSVANSTFSANSATVVGGAIYFNWGTTLALRNTTTAYNGADNAGGVYNDGGSLDAITNNLFADNTGGNCRALNVSGEHNLSSDSTCGFGGAEDYTNTDPKLDVLADNGGPGPDHELLPGSPAINAGNDSTCTALDQRGNARRGTCDLGSVEYLPEPTLGLQLSVALLTLGAFARRSHRQTGLPSTGC